MTSRARGRPKKNVSDALKAELRSVALRFEIEGREDISQPVQPGHKARIAEIAAREHRSSAAIEDRVFRVNRKKKP